MRVVAEAVFFRVFFFFVALVIFFDLPLDVTFFLARVDLVFVVFFDLVTVFPVEDFFETRLLDVVFRVAFFAMLDSFLADLLDEIEMPADSPVRLD